MGSTRAHYLRNLLTKVPKAAQPWVATMVRTIFDQPDAAEVRAQFGRVVDTIAAKYPDAATPLDEARDDLLAFTAFPHEIWRQILSNNPQERRSSTPASTSTPGPDTSLSHAEHGDDHALAETAEFLHAMAVLAEGGELDDPDGHTRRLADGLSRTL